MESLSNLLQQMSNSQAIVITPNRRLTNYLHNEYAHYMRSNEKSAFVSPKILPLQTWISQLWEQHCVDSNQLGLKALNDTQDQFIWKSTINKTLSDDQLINVADTANLARSARSLLTDWMLTNEIYSDDDIEDCKIFSKWHELYVQNCKSNKYIDLSEQKIRVLKLIEQKKILVPKTIILYGFIEETPYMQNLNTALHKQDCKVNYYTGNTATNKTATYSAHKDQEAEIEALALWALQTHIDKPDANIGCIIPTLNTDKDLVTKIFNRVFTYSTDSSEPRYNISAGTTVAKLTLVNSALFILSLYKDNVTANELTQLLTLSTVKDYEKEANKRANFDVAIRKHNFDIMKLSELIRPNDDSKLPHMDKNCPSLKNSLLKYLEQIGSLKQKMSFFEWSHEFSQLLSILGWPGDSSLTSVEHQQISAWQDCLLELAKLEHVSDNVTYQVALQELINITNKSVFHEKTPSAKIQILGLLEATGITFDYLWITGMNDSNWPPPPNPQPLIPKRIQTKYSLPHANSDRELAYCQQLLEGYISQSNMTHASYAQDVNAVEQSPSPFLATFNFKHGDLNKEAEYQHPIDALLKSQLIEKVDDHHGTTLASDSEKVRGGASILKEEARCPFKAYAEYRLHAKPIDDITQGLQANQRGTITHKVMETFWKITQSQKALLALSQDDLEKRVADCINHVLIEENISKKNATLAELERNRLTKLVLTWLEVEKNRPDFTIDSLESKKKLQISNLPIELRIDRIDQLENGEVMLIDYKTGINNEVSGWFGERPDDPQLPLYALTDKHRANALSFAQINIQSPKFKGISRDATDIPNIREITSVKSADNEDWDKQITAWESNINTLAENFTSGIALVDPKYGKVSCQWCNLSSLCRINESEQGYE